MIAVDSPFRWHSASQTHVGAVRKLNEDSLLDWPEMGLWVVADGMGGHEAGDVASRMIVESFRNLEPPQNRRAFVEDLLVRLQEVNVDLQDYAAEHFGSAVVGSTVVILAGFRHRCSCLWVGDSRIYLLRGGELRQVTRDHSQVQEMVDLGLLDHEQAELHPAGNVITRAVGAADSLAVDMVTHEVEDGDVFLLCSDGLSNAVDEGRIADVLAQDGCDGAASRLIDLALSNGARDNVTAVVVRIEAKGGGAPAGA